ncbi:MAG: hypothetical protein ACRC35_12865 [Angustibacter sp.]
MTASATGLLAGLLLGIAAVVGGFDAFLGTLVLGALGFLAGGQYEGQFDLGHLLASRRRG